MCPFKAEIFESAISEDVRLAFLSCVEERGGRQDECFSKRSKSTVAHSSFQDSGLHSSGHPANDSQTNPNLLAANPVAFNFRLKRFRCLRRRNRENYL
jgi:hypothetical protein